MRSILMLLLIACSGPAFAQGGSNAPEPFTVSISTPRTEVTAGTRIVVHITLTNTSGSDMVIMEARGAREKAELSYGVDVIDGFGRRPPYTKWGKTLHGQSETDTLYLSMQPIDLGPNRALSSTLALNDIYDLNHPGQYVVEVRKVINPTAPKPKFVRSNAIKITVAPE